eukprot:sb/3477653/
MTVLEATYKGRNGANTVPISDIILATEVRGGGGIAVQPCYVLTPFYKICVNCSHNLASSTNNTYSTFEINISKLTKKIDPRPSIWVYTEIPNPYYPSICLAAPGPD